MIETRSNPNMLTPQGRALAEGLTAAMKAELLIPKYMKETADA
jgi:hypothetical protein